MEIITLTGRYMQSNCYLLVEQERAIVIDPGDVKTLLPVIEAMGIAIDFGILTHEHCDHTFGCTELQQRYHIPFYASKVCNLNLQNERKNFSQYYEAFVNIQTKVPIGNQGMIPPFTAQADCVFEKEIELMWKTHGIYMRETPGHSPGSICILVDLQTMFSGDTILPNDQTGLRFTGGSREKLLEDTLPWIQGLPKQTTVYPGHGPSFILGERLQKPIIDE